LSVHAIKRDDHIAHEITLEGDTRAHQLDVAVDLAVVVSAREHLDLQHEVIVMSSVSDDSDVEGVRDHHTHSIVTSRHEDISNLIDVVLRSSLGLLDASLSGLHVDPVAGIVGHGAVEGVMLSSQDDLSHDVVVSISDVQLTRLTAISNNTVGVLERCLQGVAKVAIKAVHTITSDVDGVTIGADLGDNRGPAIHNVEITGVHVHGRSSNTIETADDTPVVHRLNSAIGHDAEEATVIGVGIRASIDNNASVVQLGTCGEQASGNS